MLPDLTTFLALILGLILSTEGPVDPLMALVGTAACVAVGTALTRLSADRAVRALRAGRADVAASAARWTGILPLLAWLGCLAGFHWGTLVVGVVPRITWLGRYVVLFLPACVLFASAWTARARWQQALAEIRGVTVRPPTGRAAIKLGLARNAIAILPLAALLGVSEGIWVLGELGVPGLALAARWMDALPILGFVSMLAVIAGITMLLPSLLQRFLSVEPLPKGAIRDLLEAQAKVIGLGLRGILLWKSRGRVVNAMVVGFTRRTRLVLLTDGLLHHLDEDEILAVFSHEAGHARHHHIPWFLAAFIASILLFQIASDVLVGMGFNPYFLLALHLAFVWYVLLGAVSRVFEREADVFGATHAADLDPEAPALEIPGLDTPLPAGAARMMRALGKVARVSGNAGSHRHGSIEQRIEYVAEYATNPDERDAFRKKRRRLVRLLGGGLLLALFFTAIRLPDDVALARSQLALEDGGDAYDAAVEDEEAGRSDLAAPKWRTAHAHFESVVEWLEGNTSVLAKSRRLKARFAAADTTLRGLHQAHVARHGFETVLLEADDPELPAGDTAWWRFQSHIELGRLLAAAGEPEAAQAHRQAAEAVGLHDAGRPMAAYARERLRLLTAVLAGHRGDLAPLIEFLRDRRDPKGPGVKPEWAEMTRDAQETLEVLRAD